MFGDDEGYGHPGNYTIIDNCLVYEHSSVLKKYTDQIIESIKRLEQEDLSNIDTIIVDIRGNTGGTSQNNKPLMDFLREHTDKKIICLTDNRVFSGGRYALMDLINLGATTIGDEISTPINCFGNSRYIKTDDEAYMFSISESYLYPGHEGASSKEDYKARITDEILEPVIFKPDIEIVQTKEDFINNIDTVLNYALEYSKQNKRQ